MWLKKNKKFLNLLIQAGLTLEEFENLSDYEVQKRLGPIFRKFAINLYKERLLEENITKHDIQLFNEEIKSLKNGEPITSQTLGLIGQELDIKPKVVRYQNGKKISENPEPIPQIGLSTKPHEVIIKHEDNHYTLLSPVEKPNVSGSDNNCGPNCLILACKEIIKQEKNQEKKDEIKEIKIEETIPIKPMELDPIKNAPYIFEQEINELANILLDKIDADVRAGKLSRPEGERKADELLNQMTKRVEEKPFSNASEYLFFAQETQKNFETNKNTVQIKLKNF